MKNFRIISTFFIIANFTSIFAASFAYTNPIKIAIRDSQIVRDGDTYYLTGTFPPYGKSPNPGFRISSSKDLVHWTEPQMMVQSDQTRWFSFRSWAPEIFPYKGKYYLTMNGASLQKNGKVGPQMIGIAVADVITGPYTAITKDKPLTAGNDASLFLDTDGKVYLFRSGISAIEVNLTPTKVFTVGDSIRCITAGGPDNWDGAAAGGPPVSIEGPSVFKRNGTYYLMYSSWRRGYEIGYATAPSIKGPWTKYVGNPIFGAQDPDKCKHYKSTFTQSPEIPWGQVGHGSPFFGPDGRLWFCCHGIMQKGKGENSEPHLVIAPMEFQADGSIQMKLTWTPQADPVPAPEMDKLWEKNGTPASTSGATR